jgi:dephospho-CoA kinase
MLVVGLPGGIGAGKTLAAQFFSQLGAIVIDADQLARAVIKPSTRGFTEVVARFGSAVINNGDIDRKALAKIVFADPDARKDLEAIIHPLVLEEFDEAVDSLEPDEIMVYEIPLLAETAAAGRFDFVVTIEADLGIRRQRLLDRGLLAEDIENRIASQASPEARADIADVVIVNNGDEDDLLRKIENLWEGQLLPLSSQRS